jgi:hypothetical protein
MSQLPDPTDPSQAVRSALGGIKEAIKAGREIKETAKEVNQFLDEEAKARVQWKKRQQEIQRRGDMVWVDARQEWDIIRRMREAEVAMYTEVEKEFGKAAVSEVKALIVRLRKDHRELHDEFYRKRMEARREWGILLVVSAVIYGAFKFMGVW